jgi:cytochrome c-type biogenesis protein CcmH
MIPQSNRAEQRRRLFYLSNWWLPLVAFMLVTFALFMGSNVVSAQAQTPAASTEANAVTPDQVNAVARELWCPLCSGVRLDACELKACAQMKDVIAIKLAEGEDTESIKAYFVEQYGPQVMGEPPRAGFNWLAWILPALAAVVGGFFFWRTTQRMMQPAIPLEASGAASGQPLPLPSASANDVVAPKTPVGEVAGEKRSEEEEYMEKLEEELAKYG